MSSRTRRPSAVSMTVADVVSTMRSGKTAVVNSMLRVLAGGRVGERRQQGLRRESRAGEVVPQRRADGGAALGLAENSAEGGVRREDRLAGVEETEADRGVLDDGLHQLEQRALAPHLGRDVVEDDQRAAVVALVAQRGERDAQHAVVVLDLQRGPRRRGVAGEAAEEPFDRLPRVEEGRQRLAEELVVGAPDQAAGGGVRVEDPVVLVDLDHALLHHREHRVEMPLDVEQLPRHLARVELLHAEDDVARLPRGRAALEPAEGLVDVRHRVLDAPLGDVGVGAEGQDGALVLARDAGEDDDRDRGVELVLLEKAREPLAVEAGHDQVEQDDVRELVGFDEAVERLEPVEGLRDFVPRAGQVRGHELDDGGVVVDDEDFADLRHGGSDLSDPRRGCQ